MATTKKPLNPLRKSIRSRAQAAAGEEDAAEGSEEIEVAEGEGNGAQDDSAADQLIQDMNNAAGKSPNTARVNVSSLRRSPRKRDRVQQQEADTAHCSSSCPQTPTSRSASEAFRVEVPLQSSRVGLKKVRLRPKSAASLLQRDLFELQVEEEGASGQPKKIRKLNPPKVSNPSPFRKLGVLDTTGTRGVNLDDTKTRAQLPTQRASNVAEKQTTGNVAGTRVGAKRESQEAEDNEHIEDEDIEDEAESAPSGGRAVPNNSDQEQRKKEEEEEGLRQRCCKDAEPHIEVFGCADDWGKLLVAGYRYRERVGNYVKDQPGSGTARKYKPRTDVGKRTTAALDKVLELYKNEATDWPVAAAAVTTAKKATKSIQDTENARKRGLDLHLAVVPRLVPILKAILVRLQPNPASTSAQLAPLTRMLDYTLEALEKARKWQPRPKAALGGYEILALIRDEYVPSVKRIQEAYNKRLDAIKADEEARRAEIMHEQRITHQKEMDRLFRVDKERRIQAVRDASEKRLREILQADRAHQEWKAQERANLEAARKRLEQQQRRPLKEITRKVVEPNELSNEISGRAIYQDPEQANNGSQQEPWTQAEDKALLDALMKVYQAENRFSMIHRRHGSQMPGRSIEDISRQATVIKHNLADMIEALPSAEKEYWNFMKTIPG